MADSNKAEEKPPNPEETIPPPPLEAEMPTFFHIGGWAKQCLVSGYEFGAWHFDCSTGAGDNIGLYSFGAGRPEFKDVSGGVGIREKVGIFNMSQGWQSGGILGTLGLRSPLVDGVANAMLRGIYDIQGEDGAKIELYSGYEHSPVKFDMIIPILNVPRLMGYVLLQLAENYLLAYRTVYNFDDSAFEKHALCAGFNNDKTELSLKFEDFKDWRVSIFQRIGERWAVALKADIYSEDDMEIAIGGQYEVHENALLKMKVRYDGFLGLAYQVHLSENIAIRYHAGLNVSDPIKGDHKIGLSWLLRC
ncbi:voltage-dependent anion-selective channel-like [Drosophila montana]|uniref:voltage-dependent anion-selective channel-like n=1 Tax=Drosophila montana TaxID=40370 RepID=UPI00313CF089